MKASFSYEGKRYYVYANTEKELGEKLANKKAQVKSNIPQTNMKVKEWAYFCVDKYKVNLQPLTKYKYINKMQRCVLDEIGEMRLNMVKPIDCQEVLNKYNGYAKSYIKEIYQVLRFIFGKAYDNDLIQRDITKNLTLPNGTKQVRRAITNDERVALYKAVEKNSKLLPFLVMLECGLRPSEALNLTTKDIIYVEGVPVLDVKGTKTENAKRKVPISNELLERILRAKTNDISDFLFTMTNGKKHNEKSYQRLTRALYRGMDIELGATLYRNQIVESKLDKDFVPYMLRHTFATDLARKGMDIRFASKLLGHSSIAITNDIYTNLTDYDLVKNVSGVLMGYDKGKSPVASQ